MNVVEGEDPGRLALWLKGRVNQMNGEDPAQLQRLLDWLSEWHTEVEEKIEAKASSGRKRGSTRKRT
jgi:hypothetical protein